MTAKTSWTLTVAGRDGKKILVFPFDHDTTVADIKRAAAGTIKKSPARLLLTVPQSAAAQIEDSDNGKTKGGKGKAAGKKAVTLVEGTLAGSYGLSGSDVIVTVKDLGPQIGWRTVFLVEYFGPLVIHPLLYFYPQVFYGKSIAAHSHIQMMALAMVCIHFAKRELETVFVHRFSHATMPFTNLFKNSFHYWVLSGVLLGYEIYSPSYTAAYLKRPVETWHFVALAVFIWAQLSNLSTHITLRNLRPLGTRIRRIPFGYGFDEPLNLSCPNYFFESCVWASIAVLTGSYGAMIFLVAAVGQMFVWARKKHVSYLKEFPDYPKNRKAMFPFIA